FTGQYAGNLDVYTVPVEGGEPRRLTAHPGADVVRGWSADGSRILFVSGRDQAPSGLPRLWSIAATGGVPERLPLSRAAAASLSPDGGKVAYQMVAQWDSEWRMYRGGQAQPIRVADLKSLDQIHVPWTGSNDTDPVWLGNAVYFLSDRDNTANVYKYDPATQKVDQVTRFRDFDAKSLAAGGGALVFEQGGYIHLVDAATNSDKQVVIHVRGDFPWSMPRWKDVAKDITGVALSPTGVRALFESRGEIWTVPTGKGDVRNMTNTPGAADRNPAWSPDGRSIAWFSDRSGEYQLMIAKQDGTSQPRAITLDRPSFYYTLTWSPDSKSVAFTDTGLNLWIVDVASGARTLVDTDQYLVPQRTVDPTWSPDGKWLAYSRRLPTQFHAIYVWSATDKRSRQLTDGLSDAMSPAWDASGKYLYFLASTDFALNTGWLDMSSFDRPIKRAIYFAVLSSDDPSPLLPESDEEKDGASPAATPMPKAKAPASAKGSGQPKEGNTAEAAKDSTPKPVTVRIDFPNISQRILSIDVPNRNYASLRNGAAGSIFYVELVPNQPGGILHRYDLKARKEAPVFSNVADYAVSADGKKLLYRIGDDWGVVDADKPAKAGDGKLDVKLSMRLDPVAEWKQMFHEAWRLERDFFYVRNYHGADWDAVEKMYEPWLADVRHRDDLNTLLDIMQGELAVGHSFVGGGDYPDVEKNPVGLLGADLEAVQGRWQIKHIYSGENWNPDLRAPLSAPGVKVAEGDYIMAINGVELRADREPWFALEGTVGRQTMLTVNARPTMDGAHQVTVVPIADESGLRSRAWVEGNRRLVDKLSGGKLAYVWVPNTSEAGYTYFNRYYFAQQDKAGAVVDERYNGGGSAADYMIDVMSRRLHGYFNNPVGERKLFTSPQAGIWGPKVMLVNEMAGSGGDLLPFMFKQSKVGTLVGAKTWGGLVG
ncbi:MAG: PDZ domain-containing protein, partial [Gemmatimonadaceae bacterium]